MKFPALFVSHGAPTLPLERNDAVDFLRNLGRELGRPRAILAISAHWETRKPMVSFAAQPETIHDFFGFAPQLYTWRYPAQGAPEVATRAFQLLEAAGLTPNRHETRGLDHGAWIPLMLAYPDADIPVFQMSIQLKQSPQAHLALGEALAPLRDEGVLIMASGGMVHNLEDYRAGTDQPAAWAIAFNDWITQALLARRHDALLDYRTQAPFAAKAHPSEEHLLPLFVAMGAGGEARLLHQSFTHGNLGMAAFAFD